MDAEYLLLRSFVVYIMAKEGVDEDGAMTIIAVLMAAIDEPKSEAERMVIQ